MQQEFQAPFGRWVRIRTLGSFVVLLGVAAIGLLTGPRQILLWRLTMVWLPIVVLLGALPFAVRGYTLTDRELTVKRLGFNTALPLDRLEAVKGDAEMMRRSVRLFGNRGLFAITGWYWNRRVGRYRAFATDPDRAVLLEFADRKVVITPHDPQAFIVHARKLLAMR